jgi:hypothetical protein
VRKNVLQFNKYLEKVCTEQNLKLNNYLTAQQKKKKTGWEKKETAPCQIQWLLLIIPINNNLINSVICKLNE